MNQREPTLWDALSDTGHADVLRPLLGAHPALQLEAGEIAAAVLAEVDRAEVAEEVRYALESVSTADVAARSGLGGCSDEWVPSGSLHPGRPICHAGAHPTCPDASA